MFFIPLDGPKAHNFPCESYAYNFVIVNEKNPIAAGWIWGALRK